MNLTGLNAPSAPMDIAATEDRSQTKKRSYLMTDSRPRYRACKW